jgi:hypothetical protein
MATMIPTALGLDPPGIEFLAGTNLLGSIKASGIAANGATAPEEEVENRSSLSQQL